MAIPYPQDGEQFRDDLKAAGFDYDEPNVYRRIAAALNCSHYHVRNMLSGWNKYSSPMKAKVKWLIDNNHNEVTIKPITKISDLPGVAPTSKQCRYILDSDPDDGEYRVMKIMAICDDYEIARSICNMFNDKDQ